MTTRKSEIDNYLYEPVSRTGLLAGITVANGYNTDAGLNVFRELEYTEKPDVTPSLSLFRGELTSGEDGEVPAELGQENHWYPISIEGFVSDTKDGAQGEKLQADIVRRLRSDNTLGGLAEQVKDLKSSTAVQQGGDDVFSLVQVSFIIFYVTSWGEM